MKTMREMKSEKQYFSLLIVLIILVILSGCYNPSKISYFNISSSYQEQSKSFDFKYCAYNSSPNQANVYYKFNTAGLLFIKHKTKNFFFAKYQFHYELYDVNEPKTLLDSATLHYTDTTDFNQPKEISDSFAIFTIKNSNYIVAYQFTDMNKNYEVNGFLNIDKTNEYSRNNFLLKDKNNLPLIENYVNREQKIRVDLNQKLKEKLYVSYYKQEFPLAEPPYTMIPAGNNTIIRDSLFQLMLHNGSTGDILLNEPGMYFFQTDTNQNEGFSVFRFYDNFPKVTTAAQMLKPLQYITTKQEFYDLANSKNLRQSIEKFWLDKSGNPNRAKEMIRLFYNRVQDANVFFSSYKEGWKTDRGMIYLIMGPPLKVYRSEENETWYFSEDRNMLSVVMVFNKTHDKFSDNDYVLERGIEFKDAWYNGVESWRK
jgi:GWxTD domain-containing protein